MRSLLLDVLALAAPVHCVGCGRDHRRFCDACRATLRLAQQGDPQIQHLSGTGRDPVPWISQLDYAGVPARVLRAIKHDDTPRLARELAGALRTVTSAALELRPSVPAVIVPIPSHWRREWQRGYRHLEVLLRAGGVPSGARQRLLRAGPGRTSQVGLDAVARQHNARRIRVHGATDRRLRRAGPLPDVVLFDDVSTTGATLGAAVECLRAAGWTVRAVATLFRVPKRGRIGG